jgi:hypothetical protein
MLFAGTASEPSARDGRGRRDAAACLADVDERVRASRERSESVIFAACRKLQ